MLNFYRLKMSEIYFNKRSKTLQRKMKQKAETKKWLFPLGILVAIGIALRLSIWYSYELKEEQTELLKNEAKQAFEDAIAAEVKECLDVRFSQYDPKLSPIPGTEHSKIAWADQEALTLNDSLRFHLNELFRQKLNEQEIDLRAEIHCNRNGKLYTLNGENSLEHPFLLAEENFQNGERFIKLQAYIELPREASQGYFSPFLFIAIAVGIGVVGWYILFQKRKKEAVTEKVRQPPVIQEVVPSEKKQEEIVALKSDIQYYKKSHTVARAERRSHLNGKSIIYFEAFIAKEDYMLEYGEIRDLCIKQRGSSSITQEEISVSSSVMSHAMKQLEFQLKPIDIQIKNIRGQGYRMIFPDEKEE